MHLLRLPQAQIQDEAPDANRLLQRWGRLWPGSNLYRQSCLYEKPLEEERVYKDERPKTEVRSKIIADVSRNKRQICQECRRFLLPTTPLIRLFGQQAICFNCIDTVIEGLTELSKTPLEPLVQKFNIKKDENSLARHIAKTLRDEISGAVIALGFPASRVRRFTAGGAAAQKMKSGACFWVTPQRYGDEGAFWVWMVADGYGNLAAWNLRGYHNIGQYSCYGTAPDPYVKVPMHVSNDLDVQLTKSFNRTYSRDGATKIDGNTFSPKRAMELAKFTNTVIYIPAMNPNGPKKLISWISEQLGLGK